MMRTEYENFFRDDPWENIPDPIYPEVQRLYLNDERFWISKNEYSQLLFIIQENGLFSIDVPNQLRGIDISVSEFDRNKTRLVCTLTDGNLSDQFSIVVKDVAFTVSPYGRNEIFIKAIGRILSWSDFLKPSRKGLTRSELIGLWGEMYILIEYIAANHPIGDAINFWIGPENKKQDFTLNQMALETKTTMSGDGSLIRISSEEQLEKLTDKLYLIQLFINFSNTSESLSLKDLYERISDNIGSDLEVKTAFEHKISRLYGKATKEQQKQGFEYLAYNLYEVQEDFPKISGDNLDEGILRVKYQIDTHKLSRFKVDVPLETLVINGS